MRFVVDASVAVEFLLRTPLGLEVAPTLFEAGLHAPELLDVEVAAVLRKLLLAGRISESRAAEAMDDLSAWDVERVAHRPLAQLAWSFRNNVTAYDAFYLAAAHLCDAAVLTADGPLSRVPRPGVTIQNVRGPH